MTLLNLPSAWPFGSSHVVPGYATTSGQIYVPSNNQIDALPQDIDVLIYRYGFSFTTGGGSGLVLIDSGTITTPVAFLDITLPAGYFRYGFFLDGLNADTSDWFAAAFGFGGGPTFLCDPSNFDSYYIMMINQTTSAVGGGAFADSLLFDGGPKLDSSNPWSGTFTVHPGDNVSFPFIAGWFNTNIDVAGNVKTRNVTTLATPNNNATVPFVSARVTTLRLLPYGNGDVNPPTSGETITAGAWALFGMPTP